MLNRLRPILQQDCQLATAKPILAGISGGPDSLCLLDVLHSLGYAVVVAHLNHQLRPEAEAEALLVRAAAEERGLPFVSGQAEVRALAESQSLSVEEAARLLRYRFLFEQARRVEAQAVAVAHTADDQVETVLMHLLRGAGLAGLRGMPYRALPNAWSNDIPLVRPLLGVWRSQVLAYCQARGLQPVFDRSNLDTTYYRNRLRHELLPILQTYNPAVQQALWRMAQSLAADYAALEALTAAAWQTCVVSEAPAYVVLDNTCLQEQPLAIQRLLVRQAISHLRPGLRDMDFEDVQRTLAFIRQPSRSGQRDLSAGLRLVSEGGRIWLAGWESEAPLGDWPRAPLEPLRLDVPGEVQLPGKWLLSATPAPDAAAALVEACANPNPFRAWFDLGDSRLPLTVRARRPGDRFQPLGMPHSMKLSDFMINARLPRRARARWPLVCLGDEVVWVAGYRLSHAHRLTSASRNVALLDLRQAS